MKRLFLILTCAGGLSLSGCDGGAGTTGTQTSRESNQEADTTRDIYSDPGIMGADTAGKVLGTPTQTESQSRGGQGGIGTGTDGTGTGIEAGSSPATGTGTAVEEN